MKAFYPDSQPARRLVARTAQLAGDLQHGRSKSAMADASTQYKVATLTIMNFRECIATKAVGCGCVRFMLLQ
jgi:hypothetical protein